MRNVVCLKQEKMKTTRENLENEVMKGLFRKLFEIQYELECYGDLSDSNVYAIIAMIDDVMEHILCSVDNEH